MVVFACVESTRRSSIQFSGLAGEVGNQFSPGSLLWYRKNEIFAVHQFVIL